jgi:hypothetical protein
MQVRLFSRNSPDGAYVWTTYPDIGNLKTSEKKNTTPEIVFSLAEMLIPVRVNEE